MRFGEINKSTFAKNNWPPDKVVEFSAGPSNAMDFRFRLKPNWRLRPEMCAQINRGYRDPATINIADFENREDEGILYVPKAGEMLYRLSDPPEWQKGG